MWYFWGKNSSILKKYLGYRARLYSSFVDRLSGQYWRLIQMTNFYIPIGDTSNFRYIATKVPFEARDYLIFRPKVDRWVDSTQCQYGGLIGKNWQLVLPRVKITCLWAYFFFYQLAFLQCFNVPEAVLFWFSKRNACSLHGENIINWVFFRVRCYISFCWSPKIVCKNNKTRRNLKYENSTLQNKVEIIKWLIFIYQYFSNESKFFHSRTV